MDVVADHPGLPSEPEGQESAADEEQLATYAEELADGVVAALPGWVVSCVEQVLVAYRGDADAATLERARAAGQEAVAEVGPRVRSLLGTDVDQQRTSPLAILRGAVRYPTAVLRDAGVPPIQRDDVAERQFPDDDYDLTPTSFASLDPALHEPGLRWGAAKAHVFLQRRRSEGQR